MTAPVASTRTLDAGRWATLTLAGLVATSAACVPPLPGSPYEAPDETTGAAGTAGGTGAAGSAGGTGVAGMGGSTRPTGSAGVAGTAGAGGSVACGLPLMMTITPSITPPLPAGATFTFDLLAASVDAPECPPRSPRIVCSGPPWILFPTSLAQLFPEPLLANHPQHAPLQVSSSPSAPLGSNPFSCIDVDTGPVVAPTATFVVATGPSVGAPCRGTPPPTARIFDGIPLSSPYSYAGAGLIPPTVTPILASVQVYQVAAAPGVPTDPSQAYLGFGFNFGNPPCVDASSFSGVQFTINGDLGTCALQFSAVTSEDSSIAYNPFTGACTAEPCYPPLSGPLSIGTTTVSFADMTGGMPMSTVDKVALVGIQWTLVPPTDAASAPCVANFAISNVSFVP